MDLLLLGAGMGIVGGFIPSPLHLIALPQVALNRWVRAILILVGAPLLIDGALLVLTFFSYQYIPHSIAHYVAYLGGVGLMSFGSYSLLGVRKRGEQEMARSTTVSYASVSVAALAELGAPGTWVYWLTIAGPLIAEGRQTGYWHIVPFFVGSAGGFYGAAIFSTWLMAWGAGFYSHFKKHLFVIANILLVILGFSYLARAYLNR